MALDSGYWETEDTVEVVRCKDCRYFYYDKSKEPSCEFGLGMVAPKENGFCSYGEKAKVVLDNG